MIDDNSKTTTDMKRSNNIGSYTTKQDNERIKKLLASGAEKLGKDYFNQSRK